MALLRDLSDQAGRQGTDGAGLRRAAARRPVVGRRHERPHRGEPRQAQMAEIVTADWVDQEMFDQAVAKASERLGEPPSSLRLERFAEGTNVQIMRSTRLSDRAVADMIKRRAAAVGLDGLFAGRSVLSRFATEGHAQGTPELAIMRRPLEVGHCDAGLRRGCSACCEKGTIWTDNAAAPVTLTTGFTMMRLTAGSAHWMGHRRGSSARSGG
jgi:hypothetical protein